MCGIQREAEEEKKNIDTCSVTYPGVGGQHARVGGGAAAAVARVHAPLRDRGARRGRHRREAHGLPTHYQLWHQICFIPHIEG